MTTPATPSAARRVAQAAVDVLNAGSGAGSFAVEFTAQRLARVNHQVKDVATRKVMVVPASASKEVTCRDFDNPDVKVAIDLAVQYKVDPDTVSTVDSEDDLLHQLGDYLISQTTLTDSEGLAWVFLEVETLPGAEAGHAWQHLFENRVYTGILRLTYQKADV